MSCRAPKSLITKPLKPIWPLSTVRSVMAFWHEYCPLILLNEHMTAPRPARLTTISNASAYTSRSVRSLMIEFCPEPRLVSWLFAV